MKTCIYGAGSLGTILGAYLEKNGFHVDLVSRNKAHIAALKQHGAHIVGKAEFVAPVTAMLPDEMGYGYDVVFLMTKCLENEETVKFLVPHLADDGIICTCQNGLPEPGIASIIGEERTYGCTIGWGATLKEPGVSELTSGEGTLSFSLGRIKGGCDDNLRKLQSILSIMGDAGIDEDFMGARWSKLLINASFSGLSAVTGLTFGGVIDNKKARKIAQGIMKECLDTAHKAGVKLSPMQGHDIEKILGYNGPVKKWISYHIIPIAMKKHRSLKASMLQDIEKGKPTEIDAIDGALSRVGREYGVPTPLADKTVEIVKSITAGRLKPSPENLNLYS